MDQTTHHLQRVGDILTEIRDLLREQRPTGQLYSVDDVVGKNWKRYKFDYPLFSFSMTNTGSSLIQYRFHLSTGVIGKVNPGDSVPFSASIPVFTGVDIRLDPGTTVQGNVRLTGVY